MAEDDELFEEITMEHITIGNYPMWAYGMTKCEYVLSSHDGYKNPYRNFVRLFDENKGLHVYIS